jgi:hypothetical protein
MNDEDEYSKRYITYIMAVNILISESGPFPLSR